MDSAKTQARIDEIDWYHEFDFGNGLKAVTTSDVDGHRAIWRFIEMELDTIDFRGKSVLDIGCWDGYWSFDAERRGAKTVLASDSASQNWSSTRGIHLAKELLDSKVEIDLDLSVHDLPRLGRTFDIVLCLGVFYHLHDPFHAFAQIRHCCHPKTIVVFEGNVSYGLPPHSSLFCDPSATNSRFTPSWEALVGMTNAAYLKAASPVYLHPRPAPVEAAPPEPDAGRVGWRWRLRAAAAALRGNRGAIQAASNALFPPPVPASPVPPPKADSRIFFMCSPFEGANPFHAFRPPFGLHVYDPRFSAAGDKMAA